MGLLGIECPKSDAVYATERQMWMWARSHDANGSRGLKQDPSIRNAGDSRCLEVDKGASAVVPIDFMALLCLIKLESSASTVHLSVRPVNSKGHSASHKQSSVNCNSYYFLLIQEDLQSYEYFNKPCEPEHPKRFCPKP